MIRQVKVTTQLYIILPYEIEQHLLYALTTKTKLKIFLTTPSLPAFISAINMSRNP